MKQFRYLDVVTAAIFLILGAVTLWVWIPSGVAVPESIEVAALSPDFWPRIITIGAIIAAFFLLIEAVTIKVPEQETESESEDETSYQLNTLPSIGKTVVLLAALALFYFSLPTFGIVVASMILMGSMMLFFGERNLKLVAVLSVSLLLLLYVFFRYVASVPIPLGVFGS